MLTHDYLVSQLRYDPLTGKFFWLMPRRKIRVGQEAGNFDDKRYRCIKLDQRQYRAHRLAWFYMTGTWPVRQIDHINTDPGDNRWCNLREATCQQNKFNMGKQRNNTSGYKGVSFHNQTGKWQVKAQLSGRQRFLGLFSDKEEARITYEMFARKNHGEFFHANA